MGIFESSNSSDILNSSRTVSLNRLSKFNIKRDTIAQLYVVAVLIGTVLLQINLDTFRPIYMGIALGTFYFLLYGRLKKSLIIVYLFFLCYILLASRFDLVMVLLYHKYILVPIISFQILSKFQISERVINQYLVFCLVVMIFQRLYASEIISFLGISQQVEYFDFYSGLYPLKTDYALSMGVNLYLIYLFQKKEWKTILIIPLIAVIFLSGSEVNKALLIANCMLFFLISKRIANAYKVLVLIILVAISSYVTSVLLENSNQLIVVLDRIGNIDALSDDPQSSYNRIGTLVYLINSKLTFFGHGLGSYVNPLTNETIYGGIGSFYIYLYELGIVGLVLHYLLLYIFVQFFVKSLFFRLVIFFNLFILSFAVSMLNDTAFIVTLFIILPLFDRFNNPHTMMDQYSLEKS